MKNLSVCSYITFIILTSGYKYVIIYLKFIGNREILKNHMPYDGIKDKAINAHKCVGKAV
jgi:hypothetical protein